MREYKDFWQLIEEEEVLLGEFYDNQVMESEGYS